jgi:hypothetical protein
MGVVGDGIALSRSLLQFKVEEESNRNVAGEI